MNVGRWAVAKDDAKRVTTCVATRAVTVGQHSAYDVIEAQPPGIRSKGIESERPIAVIGVLELSPLVNSVNVDGGEIIEAIVGDDFRVDPRFDDRPEKQVD